MYIVDFIRKTMRRCPLPSFVRLALLCLEENLRDSGCKQPSGFCISGARLCPTPAGILTSHAVTTCVMEAGTRVMFIPDSLWCLLCLAACLFTFLPRHWPTNGHLKLKKGGLFLAADQCTFAALCWVLMAPAMHKWGYLSINSSACVSSDEGTCGSVLNERLWTPPSQGGFEALWELEVWCVAPVNAPLTRFHHTGMFCISVFIYVKISPEIF